MRLMRTYHFHHTTLRDLRWRRARLAAAIAFLEQLQALQSPPVDNQAGSVLRGRVLPFSPKNESGERRD